MSRAKSLLKNITIDQAKRSHNCQSNNSHIIKKDDYRLCVKEGNNTSRYCVACAKIFLENAKIEIGNLLNKLNN